MGASFAHDLPFGAKYLGDGRTRFRIWAPGVRAVTLEVQGIEPIAMRSDTAGWFAAQAHCHPGALYRYRIGPDLAVADPASRWQPWDVHGPSMVVDPHAYRWRAPDWRGRPWREAVIYELHAGLCGGFRGIAARLDQLRDTGFTAVELMPVADFPGPRNWGYDGVLPFAPDSAYGAPDDLKALVDAAHARGLLIYLDVVYNHFGPDGNHLPRLAPAFFSTDAQTPWGAAINFHQPEVGRFFIENALYWLNEYRFDGLRFDAVHAIAQQGWLRLLARDVRAGVAPERHVHLVLEHDGNAADLLGPGQFDAQWNDDWHHCAHVILTGESAGYYEDYAPRGATLLARCLGEGFAYQGEASPHRGGAQRGMPSADLPPTAFVNFLQNHDQIGNRPLGDRLTTLAPQGALRAALVLQLLAPAVPLVFMGEEIGSRTPFPYFTSHNEQLAEAVREGRGREFAAFLAQHRGAVLPDPNAPETYRQADPFGQPPSDAETWRALYRRLLTLRRARITPHLDGATAVSSRALGDAAVCARWRLADGSHLGLLANLGPLAVPLEAPPEGELLHAEGGPHPGATLPAESAFCFLAPAG